MSYLTDQGVGKELDRPKDKLPNGFAGELTKEQRTEYVEKIVEHMRGGCLPGDACSRAGLDKGTFYNWLARYPDFAEAVTSAREDGADALVAMALEVLNEIPANATKGQIMRARELAQHLRWIASKTRKYNDRMVLEGSKESPVTIEVTQGLGRV